MLKIYKQVNAEFTCSLLDKMKKYAIIIMLCAGVMELADVSDSKSDGSDTVPVRPRSPAPGEQVLVSRACFLLVSSFSSVSASPPRALAMTSA